jgi:hypothetical protein
MLSSEAKDQTTRLLRCYYVTKMKNEVFNKPQQKVKVNSSSLVRTAKQFFMWQQQFRIGWGLPFTITTT